VATKSLRIPITNAIFGGDYTGQLQVGADKKPVNVILDTGSSTLALDHKAYNPLEDTAAKKTSLVQAVQYGSGHWIGSVVRTTVAVGGTQGDTLKDVPLAVAFHESARMFGKASGILGLAYTRLDDAYDLTKPSLPPTYSPNDIQAAVATTVDPYFTLLEESGMVANKFAFYTQRSTVRVAQGDPVKDAANSGFLILGGGEEATDLYSGAFQSATVVSDDWYSVALKQVIVGNTPPIDVRQATRHDGVPTNSIVDSGTNGMVFAPDLYDAIVARFSSAQRTAINAGGAANGAIDLAKWPVLTFVLAGQGGDVRLQMKPENYWQLDAGEAGLASSRLWRGDGVQSILGLPLMNGYLTIFDRSADHGLGVVRFAARK
jgi:hypothetical protein